MKREKLQPQDKGLEATAAQITCHALSPRGWAGGGHREPKCGLGFCRARKVYVLQRDHRLQPGVP